MSRDIKSLINQMLGKGNVFKYTNTAINRMHLMYWLVGEFYHSNVFDRSVRFIWGMFLIVCGLIMLGHCVSYIIFTSNLDFTKLLFTIQVMLTDFYLLVLFPLVSYIYRKDTAKALKMLDQIDDIELDQSPITSIDIKFIQRKKYGSNILMKIFASQVGMGICFFVCSNLHLIIGFTPDKLKQPEYYFYPTYCEKVDSLTTFVILSLSEFIPSVPIILMALLVPWFSLGTTREFYHRFQSISDTMDHQSKLLTIYYEQQLANRGRAIEENPHYQHVFIRNVDLYGKLHRDLLRAIDHLTKYLQFSMSASVIMFLYNEVMLVYMFFMSDSVLTQIQALNMAAGVGTFFYVNCLIGKLFSDMSEMFNESVYNMPWYYLTPSNRKSMYLLLLYQSQVALGIKAVKIYPMDMTFFLRMCNYVYSIVNVLRRYYNTRYAS